jgi:hypothetical protein
MACIGDCSGGHIVAVSDVITLVNIALGTAQPSACLDGVPSGAEVNIALIVQAVNNALSGCAATPGACFFERDTANIDCGGNQLLTTTGPQGLLSRTLAANNTDTIAFRFWTDPLNFHQWDGTYTAQIFVQSVGQDVLNYKLALVRTTIGCGVVQTLATSGALTGTGLKSVTFSGIASIGTPTDRLRLDVLASTGSGSARTLTVAVNTADDRVDVPWCLSPTPTPTLTPMPGVAGPHISIGNASGTASSQVTVPISLRTTPASRRW